MSRWEGEQNRSCLSWSLVARFNVEARPELTFIKAPPAGTDKNLFGGTSMQTHEQMTESALQAAAHARAAKQRKTSRVFWTMAKDYQRWAAALDSGKLPDIGPPPEWAKE
jgi:hypothetical protein